MLLDQAQALRRWVMDTAARRARIVTVTSGKGGVGKSVLAYNYGYGVAKRGIKTLLLDLDAQGHLTTYSGLNPEKCKTTLFNVLLEDLPIEASIQHTHIPTMDIIPANLTLSPLELSLFGRHAREYRLQRVLEPSGALGFRVL